MNRNVAISAKTSNAGAEELFGQSRNDLRLTDGLMRVARSLWPTKTAEELTARTNTSERMARYWLARKYDLSADDLVALLRSNEGFAILEAVMGDARPVWWRRFKRKTKREQLREDLKRIQHELDLNEQD